MMKNRLFIAPMGRLQPGRWLVFALAGIWLLLASGQTAFGQAPTLASLNPGSGPVGTSVTITGTNFTAGSTVSFNSTPASSVTFNSTTSLTAVVPTGATSGGVDVTTAGGTASGVSFTVTMVPTVTTAAATSITATSARLGGDVTDLGSSGITERGVVYVAGNGTPTTADTKITGPASSGIGAFTVSATGLTASTLYTVRAYAINNVGTGYGSSQTFTTSATAAQNLTISTGTAAAPIAIAAGTYNDITVTSTGFARLTGAVVLNSVFTVDGSLDTNCQSLTGPGEFTLNAGATLYVCDPDGINTGFNGNVALGAVQVRGLHNFFSGSNLIYNGTTPQITGGDLPNSVRNLTTTNPTDLTLTHTVFVTERVDVAAAGNLVLNGNGLILTSDATGTALVANRSTGIVVGNTARVARLFDGSRNPGLGYRHYAAPVSGRTVANGIGQPRGFQPQLTTSYNTSATPGTTTPYPTMFGYDQSRMATANNLVGFNKGWVVPNGTDPLLPGVGYTINATPRTFSPNPQGTLNTGNYARTLARATGSVGGEGLHLVGNPYPAPIDWSLVTAADRPGVDAAFYVFESTGQYTGNYRSAVNGVGSSSFIGSSQGFFVRVTPGQTSGTLTFKNAHRLTDFAQQVAVRRGAADLRPQVQLTLAGPAGASDDFYLYAQTGATPGADAEFDAVKLPNPSGLNLASLTASGDQLAIDGRPAFAAATVVPLSVSVPAAGSYTFTTAALANLGRTTATLVDNLAGTRTALTAGTAYRFTTATTTAPGRFFLNLAPAGVLATAAATLEAQVQVYPNPAHGQLTLLRPAGAAASAVLVNALGQVVKTLALPTAETALDLRGLASGIYTLRLTLDGQPVSKRVVLD